MQKSIKKIIIIALSLLIVVATGGLNIFIHHCICQNIEYISFIDENHNSCCRAENTSNCCLNVGASYGCCHPSMDFIDKYSEDHTDCCQIIQKFIKIEDNYLFSLYKISFEIFPAILVLIPEKNIISEDQNFRNIPDYLIKLPPLFSGKTLVFFLHQFKLDLPASL